MLHASKSTKVKRQHVCLKGRWLEFLFNAYTMLVATTSSTELLQYERSPSKLAVAKLSHRSLYDYYKPSLPWSENLTNTFAGCCCWIYVALAIFQSYRDLEAGASRDNPLSKLSRSIYVTTLPHQDIPEISLQGTNRYHNHHHHDHHQYL